MKERVLIFLFFILLFVSSTCAYALPNPIITIQSLKTKENTDLEVNLVKSIALNNTHLNLQFNITGPWHGRFIDLPSITNLYTVIYKPTLNYTGPDNFTFFAYDSAHKKSNYSGIVEILVTPPYGVILPPYLRSAGFAIAFVCSAGVVGGIILSVWLIVNFRQKEGELKRRLRDIIRDENWYPSLAIFQFLLWTIIVIFAYAGVYFFRLLGGYTNILGIPGNLLLIIGISAGITIANNRASQAKYGGITPVTQPATKEAPSTAQSRNKLPPFKTMFMENGKVTLARFQMFAWTWIGIVTYLAILFSETLAKAGDVQYLSIPDLNIQFVFLMGVSQGAYVINKTISPPVFSVNEVRPHQVELEKGNLIDIIGSNFQQETGTVWVEYYRPLDKTEKEEEIRKKEKEIRKETLPRRKHFLGAKLKPASNQTEELVQEQLKAARIKRDRLIKQSKLVIKGWKENEITAQINLDDKTKQDLAAFAISRGDLKCYTDHKDVYDRAERITKLEFLYGIFNEAQLKKLFETKLAEEKVQLKFLDGIFNEAQLNFDGKNITEEHVTKLAERAKVLKGSLEKAEFVIRVEKKGLLTYANSDAAFTLVKALYPQARQTKKTERGADKDSHL